MTSLLKQAFNKASKLPDSAQDELAQELLRDIESEMKWQTAFEKNQEKLENLGKKAREAFESGKTRKMGFDEL